MRGLRIGFLHPDLGFGGAERLVVDAAVCLQSAGHRVSLFTSHHDRARCFVESGDGTLDVRVRGDFLPTDVGGRMRAPCSIARMAYAAGAMARGGALDVIFCDLVPHVIPLVRALTDAKVVFYCHYPDLLLTPARRGLYAAYRHPIDLLEEWATGRADRVLVNSEFTAAAFRRVFPRLEATRLVVVHPGIDVEPYRDLPPVHDAGSDAEIVILSVARFAPGKNLGLAIRALACLRQRLPGDVFARLRLAVAGGFDRRMREQEETLRSLERLAEDLDLEGRVEFFVSPDESRRLQLLARCRCVAYTPIDEHFGLVPLEAMAAARPVVAVAAGGPRESVVHGETGFLCTPTPEAFADDLARLLTDAALARRLGGAGREHVAARFSRRSFGKRLEDIVGDLFSGGG